MFPRFLLPSGLAVALTLTGTAADYFVAPEGSDSQPGTLTAPWRTLQKAADTLLPGDTAFVRAGHYGPVAVRRSGSAAGGYLTLRNYEGEKPVLDGDGLTPPAGEAPLLLLENCRYVRVQGFEICRYQTADVQSFPMGIFIHGTSDHLSVRDCDVHDIAHTGGDVEEAGNAFGIAVYGDTARPIAQVEIDGCAVHHLRTGSSESLALNGNVTDFRVTNNQVHDNNNIGIVFIGYERTAPVAALDRAHRGLCAGNTVWNITSEGNQAYSPGDFSAGGIYCDGAALVTIERNVVHDCDLGIELASEHAGRVTAGIVVRDNFVSRSRQVGLALGGYALAGTGGTAGCQILNNTFFENDQLGWENGEVALRFRTRGCLFRNNLFSASASGWLVTVPVGAAHNVGNRFDFNLYSGGEAPKWRWNNQPVGNLAGWQRVTRGDRHALLASPKLFSTGETPNLHLAADSPAINAGDPAYRVAPDELDIDAAPRLTRGRLDIGADETTQP